ncbi:hypothetical protein [Mycolicibacter virginiensis]|uniref:DUF559 domain-containing protein n=1 Tax=Mycolicibacter virginiensis TaxID=1795032 RepID=A0A9X7NYH4_9MYCO|nr:hypothetical protein [Mycolicibacter virginiensis]PQM52013.1 hypothetical protein C5U48_11650 [Mycolicibacter virginiensis]ULP47357.1 hypothetical protein MJO54_21845 [Mycolicibacter virginiensis]
MDGVFIGSEATVAGRLTRHELRRWYRLLFRGVYLRKDTTPALRDRTTAAWLASRRHGVIAGLAASALHGAQWVDADVDIELIAQNTRAQPGLIVRDETLADDEVTKVAGLPVTTPARTAYDLARHLPRGNAVARLDALARATPFSTEDVLLIAKHHQGARYLRRLRAALPLVDAGAASPKETWLRLLLVDAGLPTPTTQIPVRDRRYWPFAWLDLGWEDYKVSAEYDGEHHQKDRAQYVKDHQRQRKLERLGWINIQVINEDNPQETIHRVTQALHARGWRP